MKPSAARRAGSWILKGMPVYPPKNRCAPSSCCAPAAFPDLVVSDVGLPGMTGPELALRIHAHHPGIPVRFALRDR